MKVVGAGETKGAGRARFAAVDVARGAALVAMIVYHLGWDLWFYRLVAVEVPFDPAWRAFARTIAASFLVLVGVSLVLASDAGLDARAFLRRLAKVGGAAALVTAATLVAFPQSFIFFGILHMIALGSVLALPFLRLNPAITLVVAAGVLVAPFLVSSSAFDTRWLAWTGFYETAPDTNDFEPVFPWLAAVLAGVAAGRILLDTPLRARLAALEVRGRLGRGLVWMGRWSLVIYLLHQPILLGALYPVALVVGERARAEQTASACRRTCEDSGRSADFCVRYCDCALGTLETEGLMSALDGDATPDEDARIAEIANSCVARTLRESPAPE
ncbi:heparan-alpha-glucosaminide N-acetyltransferase [Salinarimonas rosea]|uniref:heparan-alpha-glucosaminide N-acetyltransferase n=1 Tax=Salinarimonas rosea TaxID=552063 RepID=UPI000428E4ED|nr:heparan-alpha-glucosaminide N-acetyltransferase [Salinarimonas rosea]